MKATGTPGTNFKKIIKKRGIKQSWIAKQLGIKSPYLSCMLSGKDNLAEKHRQKLNEILNTNY